MNIHKTIGNKVRQPLKLFTATLILLSNLTTAFADGPEPLTISVQADHHPLVKAWTQKYAETHGDIQFRFVAASDQLADVRISNVIAYTTDRHTVSISRQALLPVTNTDSHLLQQLGGRDLSERQLKKLYFNDSLEEQIDRRNEEQHNRPTVYSAASKASATTIWATHFGYVPADLRGRRIAGADAYLLTAITRDKDGVTFASLAHLFDHTTRQLKPGLAILPLNLKKAETQALYSGSLDQALSAVEQTQSDLIPTALINASYSDREEARRFIEWIITDGQHLSHTYGYLTLPRDVAQKELQQVQRLFAHK